MVVNTIEIPQQLREVVDRYVLAHKGEEVGGILFGTPVKIVSFLPVPNAAEQKATHYRMIGGYEWFQRAFEDIIGFKAVGDVHTHPDHTIPSEHDVKKAAPEVFTNFRYMGWIVTDKGNGKTAWWLVDKELEAQDLVFSEERIDERTLLVARRLGFVSMGPVMLDRQGNWLAQGDVPRLLLQDEGARHMYFALLNKGDAKIKTVAGLRRLAAPGLKAEAPKTVKKLMEAGLAESKWNDGYVAVDIFGRRLWDVTK